MDFFEYSKSHPNAKWPYPVEYGERTDDSADVLVIGGGMSGCFAAIHAARRGKSVILAEKGATVRSGSAGGGIDHWWHCATNPCSRHTPDALLKIYEERDFFESRHVTYIALNEAYGALLDLEGMGVNIRDGEGDFDDAPYKDPETGLLFAYDYDSKTCLRIFGAKLKPALCRELKRLGVKVFDRVMMTSLLTENGRQGTRVIGGTGVNVRTGRFYAFTAKATVLATAKPSRLWEFGDGTVGACAEPNCAGGGDVMAWKAGAVLASMERTMPTGGAQSYPAYCTGNASNTWYPATMVDRDGKAIAWVDRDGKEITDSDKLNRCAEGQEFFLPYGRASYEHQGPAFAPGMPERIRRGEYKMPFYADLTELPRYEREGIFGLMLGNEGRTRIPVVRYLAEAGFDPALDMLQANITPPEVYETNQPFWFNCSIDNAAGGRANVRAPMMVNYGGVVVDWDLKSSLDGLYAVGEQAAGVEGAATAAAMGRYCGRVVARAVSGMEAPIASERQIAEEMARVYAPLENAGGYGWKEVQYGLCRIMQDYAGAIITKEIMELGLWYLQSVRENELGRIRVSNPHELSRALDCGVRLEAGEIILHNSLARNYSSCEFGFERMDRPENIPPEKDGFVAVWQEAGEVRSKKLPLNYWLVGANAPGYAENYRAHACLNEEES